MGVGGEKWLETDVFQKPLRFAVRCRPLNTEGRTRLVGCEPFDGLTGDICYELEVLVVV